MARADTWVLPKWVTQLGFIAGGLGIALEALRQATPVDALPGWANLTIIGLAGIATTLGKGLGDDDKDGIANWFDPDWKKGS